MTREPRKLFGKCPSSSTGKPEEQGALSQSPCSAFPCSFGLSWRSLSIEGLLTPTPLFFSTSPDTKLALSLLLALEQLHPAATLSVS